MKVLNWVGIALAIAMLVSCFIFREAIPWWVLPIWLIVVIVSKMHILKLLRKK